ncbi:BTB/POZ fold [Pseudocohnilembus persalinus]|uniref:BTB/POZ fold n=1 Tax=Pseudocohnilembus persalinus TaxID=266149 RepID=A0A0V0R2H7_PSEPJ|nr:BTB/POZ fold [Pseudocohnilembus persalinus]|eukprot:KRX08719.1 BTB/POZ fold [Pseudocohnilembus persalinus]
MEQTPKPEYFIIDLQQNRKLAACFPQDPNYDVTLIVQKKIYKLQKAFLRLESEYFKNEFSKDTNKNEYEISIKSDHQVFEKIIKTFYGIPYQVPLNEVYFAYELCYQLEIDVLLNDDSQKKASTMKKMVEELIDKKQLTSKEYHSIYHQNIFLLNNDIKIDNASHSFLNNDKIVSHTYPINILQSENILLIKQNEEQISHNQILKSEINIMKSKLEEFNVFTEKYKNLEKQMNEQLKQIQQSYQEKESKNLDKIQQLEKRINDLEQMQNEARFINTAQQETIQYKTQPQFYNNHDIKIHQRPQTGYSPNYQPHFPPPNFYPNQYHHNNINNNYTNQQVNAFKFQTDYQNQNEKEQNFQQDNINKQRVVDKTCESLYVVQQNSDQKQQQQQQQVYNIESSEVQSFGKPFKNNKSYQQSLVQTSQIINNFDKSEVFPQIIQPSGNQNDDFWDSQVGQDKSQIFNQQQQSFQPVENNESYLVVKNNPETKNKPFGKVIFDDQPETLEQVDYYYLPILFEVHQPYSLKLQLIYRASRDGHKPENFHQKCDGFDKTVVFIKSWDFEKVFGGYLSKQWKKDTQIQDQNAFIFSIDHKQKFPVKNSQQAVFTGKGYVFCFGGDIQISDDCDIDENNESQFPKDYKCDFEIDDSERAQYLTGGANFQVDDIEVYKVTYSRD